MPRHKHSYRYVTPFLAAFIALVSFTTSSAEPSKPLLKEPSVCNVNDAIYAGRKCHEGQILLLTPEHQLDSQAIVITAGLLCNFNFSVVSSSNALSCVFSESRKSQWESFGVLR